MVAFLVLCGLVAASLAGATTQRHRGGPSAPRVSGPGFTISSIQHYRFSAHEKNVPVRQLRFRCALDSTSLHACPRLYGAHLSLGRHVLRVRAVDPAGRVSRTTLVPILVEPKPTPAAVLASLTLPDPGLLAAGAGALWVNRGPFGSSGALYRIDPATDRVSATIHVSQPNPSNGGGNDVAYGFGSIWEINDQLKTVSRIDPASNAVTASISTDTGTDSLAEGLAITPSAVWVAEHEPVGTILKIDPSTNRVVAQIHLGSVPAGGPPYIIAAAGSVWGTGPSAVYRINPLTDSAQTVNGYCQGTGGYKMATDGVSLWTSNCGDGIGRVNPATNTLTTLLPANTLRPYKGGGDLALDYGSGLLWAVGPCQTSDCVWGIDPTTSQIMKAWTLPLAAGDAAPLYAFNSLWVSSGTTLLRLNPDA